MVGPTARIVLRLSSVFLLGIPLFPSDSAFAQCESWAFESIVAGSGPAGAINGDRLPRACYSTGGTLRYCYKDSSGWHHEIIQTTVMGQVSTRSVEMDSLDRFHVVYCGFDIALILPWIRYRYRDEQGWHGSTVAYYVWWSGQPSLALDDGMNPHVAYSAGSLRYWHLGASGAETEMVDPTWCSWTSIAVSSTDQPCICYVNEDAGELRYAWRSPIGWQLEVVDSSGADLSGCRLAHDANGQPHVGY